MNQSSHQAPSLLTNREGKNTLNKQKDTSLQLMNTEINNLAGHPISGATKYTAQTSVHNITIYVIMQFVVVVKTSQQPL